MKTVIDLTALDDNFSGIERYAANMALALIRRDRESRETACREEEKPEERNSFDLIFKNRVFPDFLPFEGDETVRFHILKGCPKLLFNQWRLPRYLNRLRADRFLFFAFPMPVLLFRRHVYGTIHDMCCWDCPETMKRQMAWYFRLSYRCMALRAERILTISEFSKSRIMEILHVKEEKILLAYCGLSENFCRTESRPEQENRRVREKYGLPETYYLCLSTLEPRKNMLLLLRAYLELYRQGKIKTKLVLAGRRGWKIDELIEQAGAQKDGQVTVTGFVEEQDLAAVYRMARCFVFPSLYEGFGIPPLEAMSQRVPVIASDSSSLPEILGDGAFYFRNNDADDLKRALLEFEQESDEAVARRVEAGYERSRCFRYTGGAGKNSCNVL